MGDWVLLRTGHLRKRHHLGTDGGTKERTNHIVEFYYLLIYLLVAYLTTMSLTYIKLCRISGSSDKRWCGSDVNVIYRGLLGGVPVYT